MGLFSGILKGVAGVIPGVSTIFNGQAINKANKAQQAGIAAAQQAFQATQAEAKTNLSPYIAGGLEASNMRNRLLGLGDNLTGTEFNPYTAQQQQAGALNVLGDSPLYKTSVRQGEEALLQNAAATGGVRGSNIQTSLAENRENLFAQVLQNYLSQLGGVSDDGLGASNSLAQLGANNASALGGLSVQSGNSNAGAILGQQNLSNQLSQQISSALAGLGGGGGFNLGSLLGGGSKAPAGGVNNVAQTLQQLGGSVFTRF